MQAISALFEAAQLGKLEPLAGLSFAVNLAYLNLRRWRYKEHVKEIAREAVDDLSSKHTNGENYQHLSQYNALMYLTEDDHKKEKLPFFLKVFHKTFGVELDIILVASSCVAAFVILCLGVMADIHMGEALLPFASYTSAQRAFCLLIFTFAVPVFFVWLGRNLVFHMNKFVGECADEIAQLYESKISEIRLPEGPPNKPGPQGLPRLQGPPPKPKRQR